MYMLLVINGKTHHKIILLVSHRYMLGISQIHVYRLLVSVEYKIDHIYRGAHVSHRYTLYNMP